MDMIDKTIGVMDNLPSKDLVEKWRSEMLGNTGIDFDPMTLMMAFIMDLGHRSAMIKYSPYIGKDLKEAPYKEAVEHWKRKDGEWYDISHCSDVRDSLLDRACSLKFGMNYPMYGDSDEYKKEFYELTGLEQFKEKV